MARITKSIFTVVILAGQLQTFSWPADKILHHKISMLYYVCEVQITGRQHSPHTLAQSSLNTFKVTVLQCEVVGMVYTVRGVKCDLHPCSMSGCVVDELSVCDGDGCHGAIAIEVHVYPSTAVLRCVALKHTVRDTNLRLNGSDRSDV